MLNKKLYLIQALENKSKKKKKKLNNIFYYFKLS